MRSVVSRGRLDEHAIGTSGAFWEGSRIAHVRDSSQNEWQRGVGRVRDPGRMPFIDPEDGERPCQRVRGSVAGR